MVDYDVIVAGIGGMGSAAAAELASRGARVLGLDRAGIPNDRGSSHGVNRIIRLAYAEGPGYVPLLRRAYERWRDLEARLDQTILVVTGGLDVGHPGSAVVEGALESARVHDLEHEMLDGAELVARYPGFRVPADFAAVFQPVVVTVGLCGIDVRVVAEARRVAGQAEDVVDPQGVRSEQVALHRQPVAVATSHLDHGLQPFL